VAGLLTSGAIQFATVRSAVPATPGTPQRPVTGLDVIPVPLGATVRAPVLVRAPHDGVCPRTRSGLRADGLE